MVCETSRHRRRARRIPAWGLLAPSQLRHSKLKSQRQVRTTEMVIRPPPLEMSVQFVRQLDRGPRATRQGRQGVTQSEIESLNESGVERAGVTERFETLGELRQVAQAHEAPDEIELATAIPGPTFAGRQAVCPDH